MNAIEIKNLSKSFSDFKLDNINLVLPGGCIMGLIGENGAGKSTLIKLILNILKKDSGTITVLGRDSENSINIAKEEIGVVLDEVGIPEFLDARQVGRVMSNIVKNWNNDVYESYLKSLSLPESKAFKDFSRGMKMKLGIAIALSHESKLLILDEATSGLDPIIRDEVVDIFADFARDEEHSVLVSSHIVSDLEKICDYITFLHKGKILVCEEKDMLLSKYGIIRCTLDEFSTLDRNIIKYKKESSYGVEAVVYRDRVPGGIKVERVGLEELFVAMAKGANV